MENIKISPIDVIKKSWGITKANFSLILGLLLLSILISSFFSVFFNYYLNIDIIYFVIFVISMIVSILMSLAIYKILIDIVDGKKTEIKQGIKSITLKKFLNAFSVSIVYSLIVLLGMILLVVPGIIFAIRFQFCIIAIIDKDMSVIESLKYSWNITKNNSWRFILLGILSFGLILAGLLALLLGAFVAIMVIEVAYIVSYRILSNKTNNLEEAKN